MKSYKNTFHSTLLALSVILVAVLFTRSLNHSSAIHASVESSKKKASRHSTTKQSQSDFVIDFSNNFDAAINSSGLVVVDFFAEWCPMCKGVEETFLNVSKSFHDKVTFGKLDIDKARTIATYFNIGAIPTFVFFKDGKKVGDSVGSLTEDKLAALINEKFGL